MKFREFIQKVDEEATHPINQAIITKLETKLEHQIDVIKMYLKDLKAADSRSALDLIISDIDGTGQDFIQLARTAKEYLRNNKQF